MQYSTGLATRRTILRLLTAHTCIINKVKPVQNKTGSFFLGSSLREDFCSQQGNQHSNGRRKIPVFTHNFSEIDRSQTGIVLLVPALPQGSRLQRAQETVQLKQQFHLFFLCE